jgi:tetratricopeptide (TPR) repeat protein
MAFVQRHKIALLLFILGLSLFANTMDADRLFSWDDNRYLEENKLIQDFEVGKIFGESYFGGYMPITLFSFALEHKIWGLKATGYHVVNVILHACNGMLIFLLLFHLVGKRSAAIIGSVLFIVHPVQVETVAWISERKNLLSMLFFLLAFLSHIRYRQQDSTRLQCASLLFYLFAVLSKPIVVGAPILFIAYDILWAKVNSRRAFLCAFPAIAIAVFGAVTILITSAKVGGIKEYWGGSHWSAFQLTLLVAWQYLIGLIDPSTLSIHYVYTPEAITGNWRVWAGLCLLLGLIAICLRSFWQFLRDKEHKPIPFFAILWVAVFMLPVSNIVPLSIQRADRFLYFPSVMIFLIIGWLWDRLWHRQQVENRRYVLVGCIVAVSVFFSSITYRLNQVWTNSGTLWSYQLSKFPNDDIAINNLAMYYFRTKKYKEAQEVYAELSRLTPKNFRPYLFMGLIAFEEERFDDAIRFLHQALPLADDELKESIVVQLLSVYAKAVTQARRENRHNDAIDYYRAVIELLPNNRSVYNDLGNAFDAQGETESAMAAYRQAISVSENYFATAHANIGLSLLKQGLLDEAQKVFEEILVREPSALAASGKCKVLDAKGQKEEALDACILAVALSPNTREYYELLVDHLLKQHSPDNAILRAEKGLAQNQDVLTIVKGYIHSRSGQHKMAIEVFRQSEFAIAQLELAHSALAMEAYQMADTVLKQLSQNEPDLVEAIGGRCIALSHLGNVDDALPLCKTAAKRDPGNSRYQIAYGDLLTIKKQMHEAIAFYQKALENGTTEVSPKLAVAHYQLGTSAEEIGVTGDAIKLYQMAIDLNPKEKEYHNSLGRMLLRQRRYKEALNAFNTAIRMDSSFALAYANKGQAAYALGEKEQSLSAYKRALEIDNTLPQALEGYCALLKTTGGTADELCQKAGNL